MAKNISFDLFIHGAQSREDVAIALEYATELLRKGYTSGDLRNESIDTGTFNLVGDDEKEDDEVRD